MPELTCYRLEEIYVDEIADLYLFVKKVQEAIKARESGELTLDFRGDFRIVCKLDLEEIRKAVCQ